MGLAERLQALRELAEEATPGPWGFKNMGRLAGRDTYRIFEPGSRNLIVQDATGGDAAYIAATNPRTLTALLDVVEKAEAHRHAVNTKAPSSEIARMGLRLDAALDNLNNLLETENGGEGC